MNAPVSPASIPELIEIVRATPRLIAIGSETKPRLSAADAVKVSTAKLSGITEYDPSEYTFTALAGTPLREITAALRERGQYLPFDPPLVEAGATLGGTVAAGLSGPGRFRFGGLRDFILGVKFVDGSAKLLRMGGKVVKNAAGFDLPKFFVGSMGRFGVLVEMTFKVFPSPPNSLTLKLEAKGIEAATRILIEAANSRWEPHALDLPPAGNQVLLNLRGPAAALEPLASEILARWPGVKLPAAEAESVWTELREFRWTHASGVLIKVPLAPAELPRLRPTLGELGQDVRLHASSGGSVAYVSMVSETAGSPIDSCLRNLKLHGLTLRGPGPLWQGCPHQSKIALAVKNALDPQNRFPALDN